MQVLIQAQEHSLALHDRTYAEFNHFKQEIFNEVTDLRTMVHNVAETIDGLVTIQSGQARILRRLAGSRIRELLDGRDQYMSHRSRYYSWLWRSYQDAFGVTSYLDTQAKYFEIAQKFIREWIPTKQREEAV